MRDVAQSKTSQRTAERSEDHLSAGSESAISKYSNCSDAANSGGPLLAWIEAQIKGDVKLAHADWQFAAYTPKHGTMLRVELDQDGVRVKFSRPLEVDVTFPGANIYLKEVGVKFATGKPYIHMSEGYGWSFADTVNTEFNSYAATIFSGTDVLESGYNPFADDVEKTVSKIKDNVMESTSGEPSQAGFDLNEVFQAAAGGTYQVDEEIVEVLDGMRVTIPAGTVINAGIEGWPYSSSSDSPSQIIDQTRITKFWFSTSKPISIYEAAGKRRGIKLKELSFKRTGLERRFVVDKSDYKIDALAGILVPKLSKFFVNGEIGSAFTDAVGLGKQYLKEFAQCHIEME